MTVTKFILKSLWYFKKQHIAVLLGTIISTAVLTGALIIGDSVKYSLNSLVKKRLGNIEYAMLTGDRFVRTGLAGEFAGNMGIEVAPVMGLQGIAINPDSDTRINKNQVFGIDSTFWALFNLKPIKLQDDEAIISRNLAERLNLKVGDEFLLRTENVDFIPVNAPFKDEGQHSVSFRLMIKEIADAGNIGRFSLKSNQVAPYNVFISRTYLSGRLKLDGYVNTILTGGNKDKSISAGLLNQKLEEFWTVDDAGLIVNDLSHQDKFEILSKRIFLDDPTAASLEQLSYKKENILTYLVNSLHFKDRITPYSFVTASSFLFNNEALKDDEIVINDWLAKDLEIAVSDTLTLDYYIIGPLRTLKEQSSKFIVKQIVKTAENGLDNSLMPDFPGLTDANSCSDWETGIPIDLDRIRDKDEEYWNKYKGTPKAYISIDKGIELWKSKYGSFTAIRFDKGNVSMPEFEKEALGKLHPEELGMQFISVREMGSNAANNGVGFGELFLSLSFFVIVSGILLTALLYALHTESRKTETGSLSALGFSKSQILRIRLFESSIIAITGSAIGAFAGIWYNLGIMVGLNSVWADVVRTNDLEVLIKPSTILTGALIGIFIALTVNLWIVIKKLKEPIVNLLKNMLSVKISLHKTGWWLKLLIVLGLGGSILIVFFTLGAVEKNSSMLLMAGGLFLTGSIALVKYYFNRLVGKASQLSMNWKTLAIKNAGLNQARSIAVIALLALGSFTILITGANRKTFYGLDKSNQSGTGGYLLWCESTMPVLNNLNSEFKKSYPDLTEISFVQFHSLEGDDASCLNLNQVTRPGILGVDNKVFDSRKAFSFATLIDGIDKDHPWLALSKSLGENCIPAYVDLTVITWGLKKKVGDTLYYSAENGDKISLVIAGGLNSSIFQGNVLISDELFTKYFPSAGGSKTFLVGAPAEEKKKIETYLTDNFTDYGIEFNDTSARLAEFNSVTNTYLTVFMVLGGLGVLIGTIGLGIVLMRNLLDRRYEIALMQSLGFTRRNIFKLIFFENFFLLVVGILIGIMAALIGILPSLVSNAFAIPGNFVFIILIVIFVSGVLWIYIPARLSFKKYLIQSLSGE